MKRKHSEIIKAWADGAEVQYGDDFGWHDTASPLWDDDLEYRVKPSTIRIGNFDVPEPRRVAPMRGTAYYVPRIERSDEPFMDEWASDDFDAKVLRSGLVHLTEEAAIIHAKALVSLTEQK